MAESERPEDERPQGEGPAAQEGAPVVPEAEAPEAAPGGAEPTPAEVPGSPHDPEPPAAEPPGPAPDDSAAQALPEALEAAAEEVPASDTGPGEGLAPQPPPATDEPERPSRDAPASGASEDVVPGAHLEPDLVLEERRGGDEDPGAAYADPEDDADVRTGAEPDSGADRPAPVASTPMDLAADARYRATGKRKSSVARVILRPGSGSYTVNGRTFEAFFPRPTLQKRVQQPLEATGYESRMDVVAKIHGGGVSSQAGALRHGIARALVVADPNLRQELKGRGFLSRDARVKERKKAGLKKARKRPQFSKR